MPYEQDRLYADHLPALSTDLFVVPAGETYLVQNITLHNVSAGTVNAKLFCHNGTKSLRFINYDLAPGETTKDPWIGAGDVYPEGHKITGYASVADSVTCLISGIIKS